MKTPEQTAVEWLEQQFIALQNYGINEFGLFEQAKEIEKEQIMDAHLAGQNSAEEIDGENELLYFKNTFHESYVNAYSKIFKKK
jgi:hypothetical protein